MIGFRVLLLLHGRRDRRAARDFWAGHKRPNLEHLRTRKDCV